VRIIEYSAPWFDALSTAVEPIRNESALTHPPFVDYYYASREWCKLRLALDKNDRIVGTLGVDCMPFEAGRQQMTLGFSSNFNSFRPGVGSLLFLQRLKECPLGVVFWTTADTEKVIRSLGWRHFSGIRRYYLNYAYPAFPGDSVWRKAAKLVLRQWPRKNLGGYASRLSEAAQGAVSVQPETVFSADMLPSVSPFTFRFAPGLDYLNWRYNTGLSFVRYRLFRIIDQQKSAGYVVINEQPDCLVIAQCDAGNPVTLARGVMASLIAVGRHDRTPRTVMLTSSHREMMALYRAFGFRVSTADECFAVGGYKQQVNLDPDTSGWLINFDWGNNELQGPFPDQPGAGGV